MKVLYTANVTSTGGRDGRATSDDGLLDVKLALPKELGGAGGATNPEQLFAAGYTACFIGAMKFVGGRDKIAVPANVSVTANVSIGPREDEGFGLAVKLNVSLPGLDAATAQDLVARAHKVCPYSHATKGNISVETVIV
ncbi:organic hydroperoxide resistance protein [Niveispirillum cyanobacteriorum]|uniref:Organic hydroperoxide resistance protein n=1 Tax=Niveispirillum cyanobacteriorum TaxID=1612173 RepID=A0A2K9NNE1_9PROT|nr:organic hydroperoxide resistance protein [Niveispirillum cyanobacteriorum]AUN33865.1 organic hydroperoxide resistance protein [Niveispirillum cyanobacteriorum]GGE82201.1 organic hydroperoxide resistance protein [Niveispirillum cyanobacteriorum]